MNTLSIILLIGTLLVTVGDAILLIRLLIKETKNVAERIGWGLLIMGFILMMFFILASPAIIYGFK